MTMSDPQPEPVTVFVTSDVGLLAVARSLLEHEAIPFHAAGEHIHGLFPMNPIIGPVRIQVPASEADRARELLRDLIDFSPLE